MGKTRDLFKKIVDIKGKFHVRVDMIKDRNCKDLIETKKRLRKGGKNTPKNYTKKCLNDPDNHSGVVTHLEPDILECSQLGIKKHCYEQLVEVTEFQLSYFKS